jgi:hypothetical protein
VFFWLRLSDLPGDTWKADLQSGLPSLRARNPRTEPINWHFVDQQTIRDVVLRGEAGDAIYKAASLGKCVTTFALPGIYAEGQRATVVFSIGPEYHGRLYISSFAPRRRRMASRAATQLRVPVSKNALADQLQRDQVLATLMLTRIETGQVELVLVPTDGSEPLWIARI